MIQEYEIMAIKSLLIKKGILTEDEIKYEHHKLLKEKRDRDEEERKQRHLYR